MYREFEDLHNMVKKMAYDHLSNSDLLSCQQPVEIKDAKVMKHSIWNCDFFCFVLVILHALCFYFSVISFVVLVKLLEENMGFDEQKETLL